MKRMSDVRFTFGHELKAAEGHLVEVLEDGDLLIEGWGATIDVDREDEAFTDNAFTKGLKKFLDGAAPLCWHHKYDTVIGRVVDGHIVPGRGVWIKAIVDRQPETSPLYPIYQAIKRGRANGFSCGGIFRRIMSEKGPRIDDVDLMEWSCTPTPVGSTALFSVVAGKALDYKADGVETVLVTNESEAEAAEAIVEEEPVVEEPVVVEEPKADVFVIEDGAVVGSMIAVGSIGTEHLSDELRSRFSELKTPEGPTLEDLASSLEKFDQALDRVAEYVGFDSNEPSGSNHVNPLASVSPRQ